MAQYPRSQTFKGQIWACPMETSCQQLARRLPASFFHPECSPTGHGSAIRATLDIIRYHCSLLLCRKWVYDMQMTQKNPQFLQLHFILRWNGHGRVFAALCRGSSRAYGAFWRGMLGISSHFRDRQWQEWSESRWGRREPEIFQSDLSQSRCSIFLSNLKAES